jgi:thiol-disulfide isomerase/thioredoxin
MSKNNNIMIISLILFLQILTPIISFKEWWEETKVPLLNDTNFYDVVGRSKYVVVKFFTKWCNYCKIMSPEYEKFYELYLKKREDVVVAKIECSVNKKICMDYGVFAFPFVALFFPENKKMKSVFKYKRIVEDFDKWVSLVAPKKNLKQKNKEEIDEDLIDNINMTQIEDYISKQFIDIAKDIRTIEKHIKYISNNGKKKIFLKNKYKENNEYDEDIIEIKITPFFIVKCILAFFLFRMILFYIKNFLFSRHTSLPNNIHQKH